MWPNSAPIPLAPLNNLPSITKPPPMPVPIMKKMTGFKPWAFPNLNSAHIAAFASFSAITGRLNTLLISETKFS